MIDHRTTQRSKYQKGASIPTGNAAFEFDLAGLAFSSTSYEIRIWWEDNGGEHDVYDNGVAQPISAGHIVVHTGKYPLIE